MGCNNPKFGVGSTYHKECITLPPGTCNLSLQYDGRPDERFGVQFGTWNLGSGKGGVVCEELRKRRIDVCCLQEVRWRGQGTLMLGMKGRDISCGGLKNETVGGVGVMVKEELCENVVEVRRVSDDSCYF